MRSRNGTASAPARSCGGCWTRQTGTDTRVAIPCGSTRACKCKACAEKARRLRIQQCSEGWHRDTEPEMRRTTLVEAADDRPADDRRLRSVAATPRLWACVGRRIRSTRRRSDMPDLPRVAMEDRTIGRTFGPGDGREYRPSMFVTLTLPSYGKVRHGVPVDPDTYDYRRAALDAVLFARLVDRFWDNLRKVAGFKVQYFAAIEVAAADGRPPPRRDPWRDPPPDHQRHRGRGVLLGVVAAYRPGRSTTPRSRGGTAPTMSTPSPGVVLPTWEEALDQVQADPDAEPLHVVRFGTQTDIAGIIAPSEDADRAIRYLTKYLTKSIADTYNPDDDDTPRDWAREAHIDRLHDELR